MAYELMSLLEKILLGRCDVYQLMPYFTGTSKVSDLLLDKISFVLTVKGKMTSYCSFRCFLYMTVAARKRGSAAILFLHPSEERETRTRGESFITNQTD